MLFSAYGALCTKVQYESILLTNKYIPGNETKELQVPPLPGAPIPQDSLGRPFQSFHMDMYEYPNDPARPEEEYGGSLPMVNINYFEAQELCERAGKRLCTIYEWRQTCGSDGTGMLKTETDSQFEYPYFGEYDPDACVTETSSADIVGRRQSCSIIFGSKGVFDLSGNVWEWVDHDFYGQSDQIGGKKAIVGGYYFSGVDAKCSLNLIVPTSHSNEKTGFRCCRDATAVSGEGGG